MPGEKINLNDLIGKKYGKLTILDAWRNEKYRIIVKVQCECGTIKECMFDSLQYNYAKSCGCARNKIDLKELIGKKYGKLTILEAWREKLGIYVKAQCECGTIKDYYFRSLKRNQTASCGCAQKINLDDLIGKKYGKLTILEAWRNSKCKIIVKAQCECGIIKEYNFDHLQNGQTTSCGCARNKIDLDDLIGKKYGRLTILKSYRKLDNQNKHVIYVEAECECGTIKEYRYDHLKDNVIQSCGCYHKELTKQQSTIHNGSGTRLYKIYNSMKNRCYNQNSSAYKYYGARGIIICDEWLNNFENFRTWAINNGYQDNLTIDRINNNGNYEPDNCRWVTYKEQANNKSNNHYITINNETKTLTQWYEFYNIRSDFVSTRINQLKWDPLKALTTPVQVQNRNNTNNEKRLHKIWNSMKQRCYNSNNSAYKYYGARGITICNEWLNNFDNFYTWSIDHGYKNDLTIDRVDTNGNYEPNNCRWATYKIQANNTRQNRYITIHNETKTLSEWCEQYNIKYSLVLSRLNRGWDPLKALTTPVKHK